MTGPTRYRREACPARRFGTSRSRNIDDEWSTGKGLEDRVMSLMPVYFTRLAVASRECP